MVYEEFKKILKENNLTIKEFAKLAGISYATCNTWSNRGSVSAWVKSWLNLYINNKNLQDDKGVTIDLKEYRELLQLKELLNKITTN
jgi:transcriptional regulator with XRE-family HTH domain